MVGVFLVSSPYHDLIRERPSSWRRFRGSSSDSPAVQEHAMRNLLIIGVSIVAVLLWTCYNY